MKFFKIAAVLIAFAPSALLAQFPSTAATPGGPVAIGQQMLQRAPCTDPLGCSSGVALVQAPATDTGGGIIHLAAFGWLEPYIDTFVQLLITAVFGILAKSKYTQWLDQSSRDALETFLKNRASSLIADGAVAMKDKSVHVDNDMLYRAANESATAIPTALKRFGLTPDVVAAKIIDAIPQTTAGAAMVATAHEDAPNAAPVPVADRAPSAPGMPPVSGAS